MLEDNMETYTLTYPMIALHNLFHEVISYQLINLHLPDLTSADYTLYMSGISLLM